MSPFAVWWPPARQATAILGVALVVTLLAALPCAAQSIKAKVQAPASAALTAQEIIRTHGCPGCHVIPGIPEAVGTIGPTLDGLGERQRIANGNLRNSPENLRRWLRNPKAVMMTMMPNTGLTEAEIDVLIKFLEAL